MSDRRRRTPDEGASLQRGADASALQGDPPVVARLMIEIRSDGSRTIARGALEDVDNGERVSIEARGETPAALAMSLLKNLAETPLLVAKMTFPKISLKEAAKSAISRRLGRKGSR